MQCPRCDAHPPLVPLKAHTVEVDVCHECNGTFYDKGEFTALEGLKLRGQIEPVDVKLSCPRCQAHMAEIIWPGSTDVAIDVCVDCRGFWLDQGEVGRLKKLAGGPRMDEYHVDGRPMLVLSARDEAGFDWRWVLGAGLFMLITQAGVVAFGRLFDDIDMVQRAGTGGQVGAHLLAFFLAGIISAKLSREHTVWEPVFAAFPAALLFVGFTLELMPPVALVLLGFGGMLLGLGGAVLGERL